MYSKIFLSRHVLDWLPKELHPCDLGESSFSIKRVREVDLPHWWPAETDNGDDFYAHEQTTLFGRELSKQT